MVMTVCFLDDLKCSFREAHRVLKTRGLFLTGFADKPVSSEDYMRRENKKACSTDTRHFRQTLFSSFSDMREHNTVKLGYGEDSFVVIKAERISDNTEIKISDVQS